MKKNYLLALLFVLLKVIPMEAKTVTPGTTIQTISFPVISNKYIDNANFTLGAVAQSGLPVSYTITAGAGIITLSGDTVKLTHLSTGTVTIKADQVGNSNFAAAASVSKTFTVSKKTQLITFAVIANKFINAANSKLTASSNSGLPVTYSVTGPATITNDTMKLTGSVGTVSITASQTGNITYNAATSVVRTFIVTKASQVITLAAISNKYVNAAKFKLTATASSGLPVTYSISGPASISNDSLILTGNTGTVSVTASQAGNGIYAAALNVSRSFTVSKVPQIITFPAVSNKFANSAKFKLTASSSSGLTLSYAITGPATIAGDSVTLTGNTGTVSVTASQIGNGIYTAAASVTKTFTVSKVAQTITFAAIANKYLNAGPFKPYCNRFFRITCYL